VVAGVVVVAGAPAPLPLQLVSTFGAEEPIIDAATDTAVAGLSQVPLELIL